MGKQIKVLSICTSDCSGGAARAAYRIHKSVRELGVDSRMFVKYKGTGDGTVIPLSDFIPKNLFYRANEWLRNKVRNRFQRYQWGKYPQKSEYYMSDLRSTDICGALQRIDYDILHLHWVNLRFLPLDKLPKGKPIVWTLHDSWPFCGVCHYFLDCNRYQKECGSCPMLGSDSNKDLSHQIWLQKKAIYRDLDLHIVTPSRWLGECSKNSSLFGRFPVTVIPNCLDVNVFRSLLDNEISPRWRSFQYKRFEKPFVLYGAMNATTDKRKGFSNLLSALRIIENNGNSDQFELIVFGTDKPLEGMSLSIPTHYVGYVYDEYELASLYNIASVMVVPSLTENLSCVIMESMSCGTPVVAFGIGGNGDMIDHRVNGYLAKEGDNDDLAKGILWSLNTPELSNNACKKVLSYFNPARVAQQYSALYQSLLR